MNQAKPKRAAKGAYGVFQDTVETLNRQTLKPIATEAANELGGFVGKPQIGSKPQELAGDDLKRARDEQKLEDMSHDDDQQSESDVQKMTLAIQQEYRQNSTKENKEQRELQEEVVGLQEEIVKLAKSSGVETSTHLERMPKKVGILDIKRLTVIVRRLRVKTEESKSGQDLVAQRSNAKRPTGMLAWVSGKQMKVHEQGTLHLQG